ncbi:MAG TPA: HEAT repeat domain-containing protein [Fimbriimonas sp.]|nr:HEAT repeat domain-containing protein [Fimbriimonas sp.]
MRSLVFMGGLGATLAGWNVYSLRRDANLATGPRSPAQEQFFVEGADRPDIAVFFSKLPHDKRLEMAKNIGRYRDPQLAKLCAKLLGDFDAQARDALTVSLGAVAKVHPDAVAVQLKEAGSFQQLGVQQALAAAGPSVLPYVVKQLEVAAARSNAEADLVSFGQAAVPGLLSVLDSPDKDVRMSAISALGKIRAQQAEETLVRRYRATAGDEQEAVLTALASIGNPASEPLLTSVLKSGTGLSALRAEAAFGLGRIATDSAARTLWDYASDRDSTIAQAVLSSLQLCKDVALRVKSSGPLALTVASGFESPLSDQVISTDLSNPELAVPAARAASGRSSVVQAIVGLLQQPQRAADGDFAEAAVAALATTDQGRAELSKFKSRPALAGFIERQERLERSV